MSLVNQVVVCVRVHLEGASGTDDSCRNRLVVSVMLVDVGGASDARTMLFRCAVSSVVSCLVHGRLFQALVLLSSALSSQIARDASVLLSLLRRGRSPGWCMHQCLNSLHRFKKSCAGS